MKLRKKDLLLCQADILEYKGNGKVEVDFYGKVQSGSCGARACRSTGRSPVSGRGRRYIDKIGNKVVKEKFEAAEKFSKAFGGSYSSP